jgi:hypothetical protein
LSGKNSHKILFFSLAQQEENLLQKKKQFRHYRKTSVVKYDPFIRQEIYVINIDRSEKNQAHKIKVNLCFLFEFFANINMKIKILKKLLKENFPFFSIAISEK